MADDIVARIILSVEYADAIEKCKELETGLGDITQAREKDLNAARSVTSVAERNAQAMEREAEAADKVAQATKRKNDAQRKTPKPADIPERKQAHWEIAGMSQRDWEERARKNQEISAQARAAETAKWKRHQERETASTPDKEAETAAIRAMEERAKLTRETRNEIKTFSEISNRSLKQEIADTRQATAEKQRFLAVQKEIKLRSEIKQTRAEINSAISTGNAVKENEGVEKLAKLNDQLAQAQAATLRAENAVREATAKAADIAQIPGRSEAIQQAKNELKSYNAISDQALENEIEKSKRLEAAKRQLLAVEKERAALARLNAAKDNLKQAVASGNVAQISDYRAQVDDLANEYNQARRAALQATKDLRKANGALGGLTQTAGRSGNIFTKAARGIGRSLSHIARLGGRGLGMKMSTEGMAGPGGRFMAGALAIGGVTALAKGAIALYKENKDYQRETTARDIADVGQTVERIRKENSAREEAIRELNSFSTAESLLNVQRLKQKDIIEKVNSRLGFMAIEVDNATGRIKNLGGSEELIYRQDTQQEISAMEVEYKNIQAALERNERFLSEGGDFWAQLKDIFIGEIGETKKENESLSSRARELQKALFEKRNSLGDSETQKRQDLRSAQTLDIAEKEAEVIKQYREATREREKLLRFDGDLSKQRAVDARADSSRLQELRTKLPGAKQNVDDLHGLVKYHGTNREEYLAANREYLKIEKEIFEIEQRQEERRVINSGIDTQIADMRDQLRIQKLLEQGREREANLLEIQLDTQKKMKREGWSTKQADAYKKIRLEQFDITQGKAERIDPKSVSSEMFKYRETAQAAFMANTTESLRLQSRTLINNTPQNKQLQEIQKSNNYLREMVQLLKKTKSGEVPLSRYWEKDSQFARKTESESFLKSNDYRGAIAKRTQAKKQLEQLERIKEMRKKRK